MISKVLLLVDGTGDGKSYFLTDGTESYYKKLRLAYIDIQKNKESEYLFFGFFTLCAATLEYSINYLLTDYCVHRFGPAKCNVYAEGYIGLAFNKKLTMLPSIISNGNLVFKSENKTYNVLIKLIGLRNRLLHNKEFLNEFSSPKLDEISKDGKIEFEIKVDKSPIDKLTKENCLEFGQALGDFKKCIMEPWQDQKLVENNMLAWSESRGRS